MTKLYLIYGIIIVMIVGYLLWNEKAKAPTDTDQSAIDVTSDYADEANQNKKTEKNMDNLSFPGVLDATKIENKKVVMQTSKGVIEFELYADRAPKSVSNFVYLADQGYYDNLTFHRVVPSFVIQGGDPYATGSGGPGYKFEDEDVVGDYKAGTVAMANSGPNTNGSQFFICIKDQPDLPKNYNLFGQVTLGLDVVSKISVGDIMTKVTIAEK